MEEGGNNIFTKRYARLALMAAFLLALLSPLGSYVVWVLGGATVYFVFLTLYYSPRKKSQSKFFTSSAEEPSRAHEHGESSQPLNTQQKRRVVFIVIGILAFIIFIAAFVAIISFIQSGITNTEEDEDRQTLVNDPNNLDALTNIGNGFYAREQYDSALYYYNRVLEVDPQNSSGHYNKSLVYYQIKEYDQSIALLKKCVSLYPDYAEAHALLGDNFYVQNNYTEALSWYRKAYDKGIYSAEMLNILGYLYDQQNNTTEAVRFYKETLQQDSSLVDVYTQLARLEPGRVKKYEQLATKWRK